MPRCSGCGQSNPAIARFCLNCGAALAEIPESRAESRKTVTVLFADVVDSTSLLDRLEPESARRVLDRFFETVSGAVEGHGGIVEKFIGDAVMAVFGIPQVHEDDALRACRAADEMRVGLARLNAELEQTVGAIRMRVGVSTGNVVVGDPARGQTFVTGEAVNVAARLEAAARPGDVLVGESTYRLVRHAVSAGPLEQLELKGRTGAVGAHRLLSVGEQAPLRRHESLFVGREHELVELMAEFERVRSESASRLVTVVGTAGVGKSRLVDEFLETCADSATIVRGRCLPYGEGITFWPLKEAIGEAAGLRGDESTEAARTRIRALVETADGDLVVERLAETLGLADAVAEHRGSTWATRRLFEELAKARPVVLVVDGLQWAEPTFLDLVEDLVEATAETPLLVLCMARPELLEARLSWGGPTDRSQQVFLQPLSDDDTERLLASLLGGAALAGAARSKIVDAADGLPLFVEEMVAMLIDDGSLRREDGRWVAEDLARIAAPASIQALLAARLDGLQPAQRAVLERGSVEGQVFHLGAVRHLSPEAERAGLDAQAAELVLKELIEPEQAEFSDDAAYRFHHLLLRDVAYESVPKEQRAKLHARFADWLDEQAGERTGEYDEIVGYHLEQAYRCETELRPSAALGSELAARGASRLGGAGLRAHARGDWFAAANLLARAVALLPPDSDERAKLQPKLDDALLETGPPARSFLATARCFWSWPPGHRWVLKERRGELVFRCSGCGKERSGGRGQLSVPDGGAPSPPTSPVAP